MGWKFAIGGISHETNSFSPIKTGLKHFTERGYVKGEEILDRFKNTKTPIGGFIDFARNLIRFDSHFSASPYL